jgi:hypothetical protein
MNKILLAVVLCLVGCASANIYRSAKYEIKCTDCKTPYGVGNVVSAKIEKELTIIRCANYAK